MAASPGGARYYDSSTVRDRERLTASNFALDRVPSDAQEHILVTGGFGSLGKFVVRELLRGSPQPLVTVLDVQDRRTELDFVLRDTEALKESLESLRRGKKLRILHGDVRDDTLLSAVFAEVDSPRLPAIGADSRSHPITGVVHLAAYSPVACRLNPTDCSSVEEGGARELTKAIAGADSRPWLLVPRRREGWRETGNITNYDASGRAFERAQGAIRTAATRHPLHATVLHLPSADSILGDPYGSRMSPVPYMIEAALGDQPVIPADSSKFSADSLVSVDDAAKAIFKTARLLALSSHQSFLRKNAFVGELTVAGPEDSVDAHDLAARVISLVKSSSPVPHANGPRQVSAVRRDAEVAAQDRLAQILGRLPSASSSDVLRVHISRLLRLQQEHLQARMASDCPTPDVTALEDGVLALDGGTTQLLTVVNNRWHALGCSNDQGGVSRPLAWLPAISYDQGVRVVKVATRRGEDGHVQIQMRCALPLIDGWGNTPSQEAELIAWAYTSGTAGDRGRQEAFVSVKGQAQEIISDWFSLDFVDPVTRAFTISLPTAGGRQRVLTRQHANRGELPLGFRTDGEPVLWRVNPVCAAGEPDSAWDHFIEDPLYTNTIAFPDGSGRDELSRSAYIAERCKDARTQLERVEHLQKALGKEGCRLERSDADKWVAKDRAICHVDCSAPVKCVAKDGCRCARDRCGDTASDGPFPHVMFSDRLSYGEVASLEEQRATRAVPWDKLVLPAARGALARSHEELPLAHVVNLPESIDSHMKNEACYKMGEEPLAFISDHVLSVAMRERSVGVAEADFAMVPFFQTCYADYVHDGGPHHKLKASYEFAKQELGTHLGTGEMAIPFFHDFGSCVGWTPNFQDVTAKTVHGPPPTDFAIAWQAMGDWDTRCVKPDRDVVMPATSRHTRALLDAFGDKSKVMSALDRPRLGYFAGGARGFGAIVRTRLACGRTTQDTTSRILFQTYSWRADAGSKSKSALYLELLNESKFCLLPRGIPAWYVRTTAAVRPRQRD